MTVGKTNSIRFGGYTVQDGKAKLYLPGYAKPGTQIKAEVQSSPDSPPSIFNMTLQDGYWRTGDDANILPGNHYRFISLPDPSLDPANQKVADKQILPLDFVETVNTEKHGKFNRIDQHQDKTPQKSVVMADVFADSVLTQDYLKELDAQERKTRGWDFEGQDRVPVLPMRTHFNKLAASPAGKYQEGLLRLIPELQRKGFSAILMKPFFGGDNLSSHRYWTTDPYVLNDTFESEEKFESFLDANLQNGMKLFADGAFVNQGLNGVQFLANLRHKTGTSFWEDWFQFGEAAKNAPRKVFPTLAYEQFELGILPTRTENGQPKTDFDAFAIRFINDPADKVTYNSDKPTFLEIYDPRLEAKDGTPRPLSPAEIAQFKSSNASIQKYRFPVQPEELVKKRRNLPAAAKDAASQTPEQKRHFLDWSNFRLCAPGGDNSMKKWDGQIDVALMNTQSEPVVNYLKSAVHYWSARVMNYYTYKVALKLEEAKKALPAEQQNPEALVKAITYTPLQLKVAQINAQLPTESPQDKLDALKGQIQKDPDLSKEFATIADEVKKDAHDGVGTPEALWKVLNQNQALKILPPPSHPVDAISSEKLEKFAQVQPDYKPDAVGRALAKTMLSDVPLNTLHLPVLFKASLSDPGFTSRLQKERTGVSGFFERNIADPLSQVPLVGELFTWLGDLFLPPSLEKAMGRELQKVFQDLGETNGSADRIRHEVVQSALVNQLAKPFYISLLTGESMTKAKQLLQNPAELEETIYKTVPPSLLHEAPQLGGPRLMSFLRKRLREMNKQSLKVELREEIAKLTSKLDPSNLSLASQVLKEREFGLNWRIDAAKDVADMDAVRNAKNDQEAKKLFKERIEYLNQFWGRDLGPAMKSVFPKATVLAELTDFESLAKDPKVGADSRNALFSENTFTSAPNMSHLYSPPVQLIHYAQRPDEFGNSQISPNQFFENHVKASMQEVPLYAQRQAQNLTSSHDYMTTSHAMLVNPELFTFDHNRKKGLKEALDIATKELESMQCFEFERKALEEKHFTPGLFSKQKPLTIALDTLRNWTGDTASSRGIIWGQLKNIEPELAYLYDAQQKAEYESPSCKEEMKRYNIPTPKDVKEAFLPALFSKEVLLDKLTHEKDQLGQPKGSTFYGKPLKPLADLKPSNEALAALQATLQKRIMEPSEAKAMRAVLNNAVVDLQKAGNPLLAKDEVRKVLWDGLDDVIAKWGAHFGHQPLDIALNHWFEEVEPKLPAAFAKDRSALEQLKLDLYRVANEPVFKKQERVFAIQNALPGNSSVYMPDLLAQGGGDWNKNRFAQNRNLLRLDRLEANPSNESLRAYLERVGNQFHLRQKYPVLNDGIILPCKANDELGILPIIRDNGSKQAIVLINTGKTNPSATQIDPLNLKATGPKYSNVEGNWEKAQVIPQGLKLDSENLIPGTLYKDALTQERFKLNQNLLLQKLNASGKPEPRFEVDVARVLIRE